MPPRSTPPPSRKNPNAYHPPSDQQTYRDLLLFEERLKTNAESLQRRKARYQLFLAQLLMVIMILGADVLLGTALLATPYLLLAYRFGVEVENPQGIVHPSITRALLLVGVTTLVLFFASGMYSEKIAYANQYVPRTNKTLRAFNMHLNVRQPPLHAKLPSLIASPLSLFWDRTINAENVRMTPSPNPTPTSTPAPASEASTTGSESGASHTSPSSFPKRTSSLVSSKSGFIPLTSIQPATNARGELIFSSRVDRHFRDSYEKYRNRFEQRRLAKQQEVEAWWWKCIPWKTKISEAASTPQSSTINVPKGSTIQRKPSPNMTDNPSRISTHVNVE